MKQFLVVISILIILAQFDQVDGLFGADLGFKLVKNTIDTAKAVTSEITQGLSNGMKLVFPPKNVVQDETSSAESTAQSESDANSAPSAETEPATQPTSETQSSPASGQPTDETAADGTEGEEDAELDTSPNNDKEKTTD